MRTAHYVVSVLIVVLGAAHCAMTFVNYAGISPEAFWFLGSGIAIILAGFLNIAMLRDGSGDTIVWVMTLIGNLVFAVLFALALFLNPEPQVLAGLLLFAFAAVRTFFLDKANSS